MRAWQLVTFFSLWLTVSRAGFTPGVDDPFALVRHRVNWEPIRSYDENGNDIEEAQCEGAKPCKPGVILPVWTPVEGISGATRLFRATVYFIALVYLFIGVSVVADRFMAAIEVITSQEQEVVIKKPNGEKTTILVRVWNETVSNLTLMALGSSAPEILLSIIEIVGNDFEAGDLGPGTIVGSAAFNLFVIIAVCILSVPNDQVRRIERLDVFYVTVVWSTFAYIWLYLILCVFSPNVITVAEGVWTLVFFFLTVINAYIANRYAPTFGQKLLAKAPLGFRKQSAHHHHHHRGVEAHAPKVGGISQDGDVEAATKLMREEYEHPEYDAFLEHRQRFYDIFTELRAKHPDLPLQDIARMTTIKVHKAEPKSRAFRRIQASRKLAGSKIRAGNLNSIDFLPSLATSLVDPNGNTNEPLRISHGAEVAVVFRPCHVICVEDVGTVYVTACVDRGTITDPCVVTCHYRTIEGTAKNHSDFIPVQGVLTFEPFEAKKEIGIQIVDRDDYENDEEFYVQLHDPKAFHKDNTKVHFPAKVGPAFEATVIIVDDDHGGCFTFKTEVMRIRENVKFAYLTVHRTRGARGRVTLPYKVAEGSAKRGKDFECDDGELIFEDKQTTADIKIAIVNDDVYEKSEDFFIELQAPTWHKKNQVGEDGADGRPILGDHKRCKVVIIEDDQVKGFVDKALKHTTASLMVGTSSWKDQFTEALSVDVGDDEDEEDCEDDIKLEKNKATESKKPTTMQWISHFLFLPWKLLFAFIPPTDYLGGWLCFAVCIFIIGVLTAIVGDVASMFGCTIGLKDVVTAITLVAVGTSVPDLFASRLATVHDETADAAVGNVTGSNAVNVFLGIGVAWLVAAIYHARRGTVFRVKPGSLASSVLLFLIGSALCIGLLAFRRRQPKIQAELGGPRNPKYLAAGFFIAVWLIYVLFNILSAYCVLPF